MSARVSESVAVANDAASVSALLLPPPNHLALRPDRRRVRGAIVDTRDGDLDGVRSSSAMLEDMVSTESGTTVGGECMRRKLNDRPSLLPSQLPPGVPGHGPDGASLGSSGVMGSTLSSNSLRFRMS